MTRLKTLEWLELHFGAWLDIDKDGPPRARRVRLCGSSAARTDYAGLLAAARMRVRAQAAMEAQALTLACQMLPQAAPRGHAGAAITSAEATSAASAAAYNLQPQLTSALLRSLAAPALQRTVQMSLQQAGSAIAGACALAPAPCGHAAAQSSTAGVQGVAPHLMPATQASTTAACEGRASPPQRQGAQQSVAPAPHVWGQPAEQPQPQAAQGAAGAEDACLPGDALALAPEPERGPAVHGDDAAAAEGVTAAVPFWAAASAPDTKPLFA